MLTKRGISYDLNKSPYSLEVNGITYVFSSQSHLDKFIERLLENRDKINESLTNRFKFKIKNDFIADVTLYIKIETRGFLIINKEGERICKETIILDGANVMKKS